MSRIIIPLRYWNKKIMLFFPSTFTGYEHALASCLKEHAANINYMRAFSAKAEQKQIFKKVRLGLD